MPFEGPEGQGPFDTFADCVSAMEDEEGIDDPEALCAAWEDQDKNQGHAMTDPPTDEPEHRTYHQASASDITLREVDDESDSGLMSIRMPIASTGDVRNEGDEPMTREELSGMARQINDGDVGVFLAHGESWEITDARYGQTERLGTWREAEVSGSDERDDGDGSDLLFATAEMPDPETLPAATGRYREALAIIKEQAKRNVPLSASIGWRADDESPGGNDLMEASIVGIPADPRTVTQSGPAAAVARAAVAAGADPEELVAAVREAVTGDRDPADADTSDADRAPSDIEPLDFAEFVASHFDGADSADLLEAWEAWEYVGAVDMNELAAFIADVVDQDTGTVQEVLDTLMSDNDEDESADENQAADTDGEAQTERQEAPEWAERMLELQEEMADTLGAVAEAVRQEDDDEEDEDDEEDQATDEDEDEEDEGQSADGSDEERSADTPGDTGGKDLTDEQRRALETLREGGFSADDLDLPDAVENDADDSESRAADDGPADDDEDAAKALVKNY